MKNNYCPNCGMKLNGMDKKCPMCGKKAEGRNDGAIILIAVCLCVVVFCITCVIIIFAKNIFGSGEKLSEIGNASGYEKNEPTVTPTDVQTPVHVCSFTEPFEVVNATCDEPGYMKYRCECGEEKIKVIPAGHVPTEATCTMPSICIVCGKELSPALGHDLSSAICSRCGEKTFTKLTYHGNGADAIAGIKLPKGTFYFTFKNTGRGNFIVDVNDRLAVNEIGPITYIYKFVSDGSTPIIINITMANGDWTLDITLEE